MEEDKNSLKSIVNKIKSKIHLYWNKIKKFVQYSQCGMHLYCLKIILGMILYILHIKLKNKLIVMVFVQFQNINICFCDLVLLVTYKTKRNFE